LFFINSCEYKFKKYIYFNIYKLIGNVQLKSDYNKQDNLNIL